MALAVSLRRNDDRRGLLALDHLPPRYALADARAQPPAQRLLLVFDRLRNGGDPAVDARGLPFGETIAAEPVKDYLQVGRDVDIEAPIIRTCFGDVAHANRQV